MPEGEHLVFMVEDAPAVNEAFKDLEKTTRASAQRGGKELADARAYQGRTHRGEGGARQGGVIPTGGRQGKVARDVARRRDEGEMRPLAQALAAGAASAACFCAGDALAAAAAASGFPACDAPVLLSAIPETGLAAEPMALAVGLMAACIPWAVWARSLVRAGTYRQGEEHGPPLGDPQGGRAFMDSKGSLEQHPALEGLRARAQAAALRPQARPQPKRVRAGRPGSGKTRYYVKPNLMQANADFLVTDPKGTLLGEVGWMLEDAGYDIRTFDTTDFSRSMHYNPLSYVKDQADILVFVECLIKNTTPDDRKGRTPSGRTPSACSTRRWWPTSSTTRDPRSGTSTPSCCYWASRRRARRTSPT